MKGTVMVVAAQSAAAGANSTAMATATTPAMASSNSSTASRAAAAATATPTGPRILPVTGGEAPISILDLAGLAALMAGVRLRRPRSV
jgi:hypothetical protein